MNVPIREITYRDLEFYEQAAEEQGLMIRTLREEGRFYAPSAKPEVRVRKVPRGKVAVEIQGAISDSEIQAFDERIRELRKL